jgi:hypothetical protein
MKPETKKINYLYNEVLKTKSNQLKKYKEKINSLESTIIKILDYKTKKYASFHNEKKYIGKINDQTSLFYCGKDTTNYDQSESVSKRHFLFSQEIEGNCNKENLKQYPSCDVFSCKLFY